MSEFLNQAMAVLLGTIRDVAPIAIVIIGFQVLVLRRRIPNLRRLMLGFVYVLAGLAFFLMGLEQALFPLGRSMAMQLTDPAFVGVAAGWVDYYWVYIFAFSIGFATTIAEPALIAVALKANEVSGGAVSSWGLRIAVALGVGFAIMVGSWRIVVGAPIHYFIITGYVVVLIQTAFAPKNIIPLAYDSGGVTTSTVTVPLVAALGLGLAEHVPGRSPLIDGFGLIAFASLFPIISVMFYAQITDWLLTREKRKRQIADAGVKKQHGISKREVS